MATTETARAPQSPEQEDGFWAPMYTDRWHYWVDRNGHLRSLCGFWKAPGGTGSSRNRRIPCKACWMLKEGRDKK